MNVVLIVSVINVLTWISRHFVLFEMTEIRNILEQVSKYCDIKSLGQKLAYKDVQQNWLFADCDLPIITVNKDGIVVFQSSIASPMLQIPNGIHIMDSKLPNEMINEVLKRIEIYKKDYNPRSEDLFTAMQMHFVVCPHYKFNGQKLDLSYLALINIQSHMNEKKEIKKKIDQLALCSYPSFIKAYATYTSPGRFTNVGIIKIPEFDNPEIELNKLASMRMMVTDKLCKLMNINMNYCRLREEGSLIITTVNRNSEATPWNMHTLGAEFMRKLREMIAKVGEMYNFELKPVVLLYRCHDAPLFVSQEHLAVTAFDMGFEYSALERIDKCVTTSVNYTAEKAESKPQSVTRVRSCVTPRGENFDILVIV
ncbi:hypothetical protein TVAG_379700 [Trichomonas vaginalis G3]|uniref:Uncharacterized protein n=1 Tax=Trichomonas vaginalis (strain ATCC PRA-98 / G3) TaxID=412133 RepID=A2E7J5_TRIV3|nr:hypothetical protein TVAGG3_0339790 [Trichomonas vaginalis G3]EAY11388.1 hypothetical protein TVAG_379700 [Trichomonas vaginalis G3]KAI5530553.1 hypothetical protein TVAGG3_0339790 [Trichomonas vaginalis G3]|eukprot:XP_001323611.1 hypothetical protein [Trichomonas vaginalis G3]